jgi:Na+/H+-dicarboxylate symporter
MHLSFQHILIVVVITSLIWYMLALAIFDVFKAHRSDKLLALHKKSRIAVVFVPASCIDKLQPLDQRINKKYKEEFMYLSMRFSMVCPQH